MYIDIHIPWAGANLSRANRKNDDNDEKKRRIIQNWENWRTIEEVIWVWKPM